MKGQLTFITGGARSGKSRWAEELVAQQGGLVAYLATCMPRDDEMIARVKIHQARRPSEWTTVEEPLELADAVRGIGQGIKVILLDCLTLWLSNLLIAACPELEQTHFEINASMQADIENKLINKVAEFISAAKESDAQVVVVSNEVGLGIVPEYPLSRLYRDILGRANQMVAAAADEVYLVVAGIPIEIKQMDARRR